MIGNDPSKSRGYRTLTPADAAAVLAQEQREVAEDWTAAYARYMGSGR